MTAEQALAKAINLWGPQASTFDREDPKHAASFCGCHDGRYWIGRPSGKPLRFNEADEVIVDWPYGNGNTWEEAFVDAEKHPVTN